MRQPADAHDLDDRPGDPVVVQTWLGAPALSYERRPYSLSEVLDRALRRGAERVLFTDVDGSLVTVRAFADRVAGAVASLQARGIGPGQAVAVASGNTVDLAVLLFACAHSGAVCVGLNTRLAPPQWEYMTEHMQVVLHLAAPAFPLPGALDLASVLREQDAVWDGRTVHVPQGAASPEAGTYAVVFTSGTTGRPKASQVVQRASIHSAMSYQRVLQLGPEDVVAVLFPLYYISALHAHVLPALLGGARCVLLDSPSPTEFVDVLHREQVTWAYAVPSWWRLCLRVPGFDGLPELRLLGAGGAPFGQDLVEALRSRVPSASLMDVYGLSETHSPACLATDEDLRAAPGTVGPPLPCMELQVRDEDGGVLPAGSPGQLWLRGSLVTTGYAHDPEATAAAIVEGWFDTGDVAVVDEAGRVRILDRTKDMINRGGAKIFSAEVEEVLRRHPLIDDAAVVGVPDPVAGEAVAAFVVTGPAGPDAAAVRRWVREQMSEHAVPRRVVVLDALPRNAVGKTDKLALRARLRPAAPLPPQ